MRGWSDGGTDLDRTRGGEVIRVELWCDTEGALLQLAIIGSGEGFVTRTSCPSDHVHRFVCSEFSYRPKVSISSTSASTPN